jgi:hypothetical protein
MGLGSWVKDLINLLEVRLFPSPDSSPVNTSSSNHHASGVTSPRLQIHPEKEKGATSWYPEAITSESARIHQGMTDPLRCEYYLRGYRGQLGIDKLSNFMAKLGLMCNLVQWP